jgi:ABC-type Mn2+/Zn2+ transport system ATPase subunit
VFAELRAEGRTLLVSTHDVESARKFDLVLCLNRRQVAFGDPGRVLDREVLELTYGGDIVVLETTGDSEVRAITVQHHDH